jgi:hypothetical protein
MSYRAKRFTFGSKTTAQIDAITILTNPELLPGMSVWNSDLKKPEYWTGTVWTNEDCVLMINTSGSTIDRAKFVKIDVTQTSTEGVVLTTGNLTTEDEDYMCGVVHRGAASGGTMVIAIQGIYPCKIWASDLTSTRGNLVQVSTTPGELDQTTTTGGEGVCGIVAESLNASQMSSAGNIVKCMIGIWSGA